MASVKLRAARLSQNGLRPSLVGLPVGKLLMVAALSALALAAADGPPQELVATIAEQGSLFEAERQQYTYQQSFKLFEFHKGVPTGRYHEVREIIFSADGERDEKFIKGPMNNLKRLILTEEDFRDLREVNPFVLTNDTLWRYTVKYKGTEALDGADCYVYRVAPSQVLEGQRFFEGVIWVSVEHRQVVRVSGKPVPQLHRIENSNLFPGFTTFYEPVDGKFWFPVKTLVDDVLPFPSGGIRVKHEIEYSDYKRFGAESTITFAPEGK